MKITVDIPEKDLKDIMRFSGEKKKGPAIAKFGGTQGCAGNEDHGFLR